MSNGQWQRDANRAEAEAVRDHVCPKLYGHHSETLRACRRPLAPNSQWCDQHPYGL